ncbi:[protein-PII] uridylyltransferase family protein [Cochlodiniinecator piscidefendens]|uniref:[protein-PII] uridylyltransferase family protein n=1 Tax=Cochlodiniinecator piscidefendens TaxID=2715756 RepID=UPI00140A578A|nr:glutamine-synthetase adenylyltransferase [Cochlodiniinecator piscidefendens]
MTFASRISRTPIPFDIDRAEEALLAVDTIHEARALILGAAGCSPYFSTLMLRENTWLRAALEQSPETVVAGVFEQLRETPFDQIAVALRQAKRRIALFTGLADVGGVWALEHVTGTLSDFADLAVDLAMKACVAHEIKRKKLPGMGEDDIATAGGMVALAMGKMGAGELNYSSDIDLICLFDESRFAPEDYHDARASFIRATRKMAAMLNDPTGEGYVFRTDLRLRPDPLSTPVCLSMETAERYYESLGRTWERAAHIKARPCAGDVEAGWCYLDRLRPFVWRKHLDFAAIQDAHDMRLRIRDHKGLGGAIKLSGHNMKLGRGGIREIEFFTQTRQLISGGRDVDLRCRGTVDGLAALAQKGWVPKDVADTLTTRYRTHREIEHRLQMVNDAQTHSLPTSDEGFERLAAFMGEADVALLKSRLRAELDEVHDLTEGFFAPDEAGEDMPELSETAETIVSRWSTYPALRSDRAVTIFRRLKPELLKRLYQGTKPDEVLTQFDGFLANLPAGVQLFSLFEANPQLIDLLADICTTSPALAQHLSKNSSVLDAVLGGSFFAPWPGMSQLREDLNEQLENYDDYERQLDGARRWAKEWHFRIGVHHLRGLIDAQEAAKQYADLAEAAVAALWGPVSCEFARKHGAAPGKGAMVLGMGSLGAGRLSAQSDLDLIVIYDADGVDSSDGRRPLATRPYYARLTQALVAAVSAQMAEGRLYEVDMRLRPSGRQGPVATSVASFENYQRDEAWTWEHLALTRARAIAGEPEVMAQVESLRTTIVSEKGAPETVLQDVIEMRERLAEAKPATHEWEAKLGPGRMQDIELCAEAAALMSGSIQRSVNGQLSAGVRLGWLTREEKSTLMSSYTSFQRLQLCTKLLTEKPLELGEVGSGGVEFLLRELGETDGGGANGLALRLNNQAEAAGQVVDTAMARIPSLERENDRSKNN